MKSTTKTKWLVWGAAAGFVILIVALCALCYPQISSRLYVTKAMKVLHGAPSTQPNRSYQGFPTGGFIYQLKGPIPEADFLNCMKTLGLTKYDPGQHGAPDEAQLNKFVPQPKWWNQASGLNHYYFRNSLTDRFVVRAKWENGHIYFLAIEPGL